MRAIKEWQKIQQKQVFFRIFDNAMQSAFMQESGFAELLNNHRKATDFKAYEIKQAHGKELNKHHIDDLESHFWNQFSEIVEFLIENELLQMKI
jgi:hypothetical protein